MALKIPVGEADKLKSYYKYYLRDMKLMPADLYDSIGEDHGTPAELGLTVYDRSKLLEPGYLPMERGHCVDKNGSPVLANLTYFPGCTPEMFEWWFVWHSLDHLRYRIWDPEDHYFALNQNLARALDHSLSVRERTWDVTHLVDENIFSGSPYEAANPLPDFTQRKLIEKAAAYGVPHVSPDDPIALDFKSPAEYGFDTEKLYNEIGGTMICANGHSKLPGVPGVFTVMIHYMRPCDGGCELRTRFWGGYQIIKGKVIEVQRLDPDGSSFIAMKLLQHNIKEFNNLASFLPEIYAEEKDNW